MPEVIHSTHLDANEGIVFARELEHIKAQSYDVQYPEYKAQRLIPVSSEAGPGAESITYDQYDSVGVMKIIGNYADDLPRADVKGKQFTSPVRSIGGSYGYNIQEIRAAVRAGKPLQARRAAAARQAYEQSINKMAWFARNDDGINGGLTGLLYSTNITKAKVQTGVGGFLWTQKTNDEMYLDMADAVNDIIDLTNGVEIPNTLLLPVAHYTMVATKRMAAGTDTTILSFFQRNFPGVSVEWVAELKNVNPIPSTKVATATNVMVAYRRDPMKLTLEIPQMFEQFPAQERGLEFVIPTHARCGGVIVYYPLSVSVIEGI